MTYIVFYEKPGCINNARQKAWLQEAGHSVEARNLLNYPWTKNELLRFFEGLPVHRWFNRSAPAVKSGRVVPETLREEAALERLLADPLLIRRPLIWANGKRHVGFEVEILDRYIGLPSGLTDAEKESDQEACPVHPG